MTSNRLPPIWSRREGLLVLLSFLGIVLTLSAAHMLWVKYGIGFEAYFAGRKRMPPSLLIISQTSKIIAIAVALGLVALRWRGLRWEVLGVRRCDARWLWLAAATAVAGFVLSLLLAKLLVHSVPDWARQAASRYAWNDGPAWQMLLLCALTILLTPLAEELFFRGFLLRWMASQRPLWLAVAISSAMFGASHIVPAQMIVAALMAVLLAVLYLRSGSIWPSVLCHCLNNAVGVLLGMAANAGQLPAWLTPPG